MKQTGWTTLQIGGLTLMGCLVLPLVSTVLMLSLGVGMPESTTDVLVATPAWLSFLLAAAGVTALVVSVDTLRVGVAGYLAVGFTWLGGLYGVTQLKLAAERQLVLDAGRTDLFIHDFAFWMHGTPAYWLLTLAGLACLGFALTRSRLAPHWFGYAGLAIGSFGLIGIYAALIVTNGDWLGATIPAAMLLMVLWLFALGVMAYRDRGAPPM